MKATKHKSGWTSGWKKMAKPFQGKDQSDPLKNFHHSLSSEKHLKAAADTIPLYQQMNILHPTDVQRLQPIQPIQPTQTPKTPVQAAAPKALVPSAVPMAPIEAPRAKSMTSASKIPEAKLETPVKVIVMPKGESPKVETVPAQSQSTNTATTITTTTEAPSSKANGTVDQVAKEVQPPKQSVSSTKTETSTVRETAEASRDSTTHPNKNPKTPGRQSRSQHRASSPPPDAYHGRLHRRDSDTLSVSTDTSYSSFQSSPRHRHRDTSSGHRLSEDRNHRGSPHGRGRHKSHNWHRDGSAEHHTSSHHRERSPDNRHRRTHHSPDHHLRKDHHHHSKDPPRVSNVSNHKTGSDHHPSHHSYFKPHHKSHRKHHHKRDYDSASNYSSDSGSRPSRPRRHSGV